jgi:hypothetical protein
MRIDPSLQTPLAFNGLSNPQLPYSTSYPVYTQLRQNNLHDDYGLPSSFHFDNAPDAKPQQAEVPTIFVGKRRAHLKAVEALRAQRETTGETQSLTQISTTVDSSINSDHWSLVSTPSVDYVLPTGAPQDLPNVDLKGKIWPGMAGFDAATPFQKSKRNQ